MQPVSVVMITHNEEMNIRAALEGAKWADEIVVVDSFSTDFTIDICREYTDKVFQKDWRGFSGQKNLAVGLASHDWVFVLDADERFTDALAAEVRGIMERGPDKAGYFCPRKNHFMGREIKYGGWYPDYSLRLFDRRKGAFEERAVHEAVKLQGEAGRLTNPMLHFTYTGISDFMARMDKYSTLAAEELKKSGRKARLWEVFFRPAYTFNKMYFLQQGLRDGMHGLVLALLYSCYTFFKYAKLWEMEENARQSP